MSEEKYGRNVSTVTMQFAEFEADPSAASKHTANGYNVVVVFRDGGTMLLGACVDAPGSWDDIE